LVTLADFGATDDACSVDDPQGSLVDRSMIPVTRPRRDWVAMLVTLRPCRAEVQSVGDAYRDHGEWAAASVLERGIATIEAALARRDDPVTITGPRWRWDQLFIAFDLGCEEWARASI
jgi:hypothetical protein